MAWRAKSHVKERIKTSCIYILPKLYKQEGQSFHPVDPYKGNLDKFRLSPYFPTYNTIVHQGYHELPSETIRNLPNLPQVTLLVTIDVNIYIQIFLMMNVWKTVEPHST